MNKILRRSIPVPFAAFFLSALGFSYPAQAQSGFAGAFAPSNWTMGENPGGQGMIDTSNAPQSITIKNFPQWSVSGAAMMFTKIHSGGTVAFSYTITGGSQDLCPATYVVDGNPTVLERPGSSVSFDVGANESFGFALNGQNIPSDFGCQGAGYQNVAFTISNFSFTPSSGPGPVPPPTPVVTGVSSPTTNDLNAVVRVPNGKYFAAGAGGVIIYSDDGVNWTANTPVSGNPTLMGLATSSSLTAAVGRNAVAAADNLFVSTGATNWSGDYASPGWNDVAYPTSGSGFFVAVGSTSIWNPQTQKQVYTGYSLQRGTDPLNQWMTKQVHANTLLNGVTWHGDTIVAVGMNILTSGDGTTWTSYEKQVPYPLQAVTWGDSKFIAVGTAGGIVTSTDGTSWTVRSSGTSNTLTGVACSGGSNNWCLAVGPHTLLVSTDGINWTSYTSLAQNKQFQDVAWTGTEFTVVGAGGNIWKITSQ